MSKRARMSLASLSGAAKSNIIQSLGTLAKNCNDLFCCSGEIDKPATIVYKINELWNAAYFPSDKEDAMLSGLMEASSLASFGVGGETVTDVTYRDARKLEPENFLTSIQLSGMSILPLVIKMLVPNMRTIRAELYKLNIYRPGGHFKPHVPSEKFLGKKGQESGKNGKILARMARSWQDSYALGQDNFSPLILLNNIIVKIEELISKHSITYTLVQ
eukprot:Em0029g16a